MVSVGLLELDRRLCPPLIEAKVEDVRTDHVRCIDRGDGHGTTHHGGDEGLPPTAHREANDRILWSLERLHDVLRGDRVTYEVGGVGLEYAVAGLEPCPFARSSLDDTDYDDGVEEGIELYADPSEGSFKALGRYLVLLSIEISRVGVQLSEDER